ncbi:MAG: transposase, partial [Rheinheimera sp.]|nr:transposase [Rheinheimera sp.]
QRMQIEESFRDMKSTQFGLGFEKNGSTKLHRINLLLLLSNLASLVLILLGVGLTIANQQRRFQANSYRDRRVLSFHSLGLRAVAKQVMFTTAQWRNTLRHCKHLLDKTSYNIEWEG